MNNYSDYAVNDKGEVIELDTQSTVSLIPNKPQSHHDYKLLSDEKMNLEIKGKTIRLWRRLTVEEIAKAFHSPSSKIIEIGTIPHPNVQVEENKQIPHPVNFPTPESGLISPPLEDEIPHPSEGKQISINGVVYNSLKSAALATGADRKTIRKRLDDETNPDYKYL